MVLPFPIAAIFILKCEHEDLILKGVVFVCECIDELPLGLTDLRRAQHHRADVVEELKHPRLGFSTQHRTQVVRRL